MLKFLDLEASSLEPDGWPVEVGLAWLSAGKVEVCHSLIRPDEMWSPRAWSPASAAVHGIPLAELRQAPPAPEVARWAASLIGDATVVSDAPEFDARWLARLYETEGGLILPLVRDFEVLVAARCDMAATRRVYAALDAIPAPHRAGPDAERLARAWAAGREDGR